jgi:anti-sigma factor RsiW
MTRTWPHLIVYPGSDDSVTEDDLQAYVDGQSNGGRRATVEAYLADRPEEAARLAAYRAQNIGMHALFDPPPGEGRGDEKLPPRMAALAGALDAQLRESAPQPVVRPRRRYVLRHLAASVAIVLTAGTAGWIALEEAPWRGDSLVAFTRQATEGSLQQAATTAGAAGQGEQRQVVAWLAALPGDVPATVPDLEALGFSLVGEHLLPNAGGAPTAQLLYQDDEGQRISLSMRTGGKAGQTSFTFTRDGDESRFVWQDANIAYSLVGSMPQEKLLKVAEAVSKNLRDEAPAMPSQEAAQSPKSAEAGGMPSGSAPDAPAEPASPNTGSAPLLDKSPLIPVPLPEAGEPKET